MVTKKRIQNRLYMLIAHQAHHQEKNPIKTTNQSKQSRMNGNPKTTFCDIKKRPKRPKISSIERTGKIDN